MADPSESQPPLEPSSSADIRFSSKPTAMADRPSSPPPPPPLSAPPAANDHPITASETSGTVTASTTTSTVPAALTPLPHRRSTKSPQLSSHSSSTTIGAPLPGPSSSRSKRLKRPSSRESSPEEFPITAQTSNSKRRTRSISNTILTPTGPLPVGVATTSSSMPGILVPEEVTYTPTTKRVSKAKKGKRVHVCEYEGCGKIFSRAEHRKRHEANHLAEPLFRCEVADCGKPFQRADLLHRHMERQHNLRSPGHPPNSQRARQRRGSSQTSSRPTGSQAHSPVPAAAPAPAAAPSSSTAPPNSGSADAMSINSIITPRTDYAVGTDASWPSKIPVQLGPGRPGFFYGLHPSDETTSYSSDSCHSPISEGPTAQLYPQPYLPQYQNPPSHSSPYPMDIQPTHFPHVYGNPPVEPGWNEFDDRHVIDDNLGIGLEGQFPNSVGTQSRTSRALLGGGRIAKYLRRSLSISPWNDTTSNAVVRLNDSTIQHYYDCYWKYFHDVCSVVHFATFMSTDRSTVLAKTMLAIGSQFSPRPLSGSHSITFFGDSIRLLDEINNQGNPITSRYPLVFLQTIVLQEAFALYRSRHAGVYRSPAFSSLYSSLLNNRKQLDSDPAEDYDLSDENLSAEDLQKIHISWADQEARRRLLLAAFVHDTQRDVFFPLKSRRPTATKQARQLPLPCDEPLWNALDAPSWRSILQASRAQSIPSVNPASNILSAPVSSIGKHPMTPHVTPPPSQTKSSIIPSAGGVSFQGTIDRCVSIQHHTIPSSKTTATTPVSDALLMATNTPIQSLLTVAAECWLYANKVEERSTWLAAKSELRTWVDSGNVSAKAVWHAVQLLRAAFPPASVTDNRTTRMEKARRGSMALGLAENWCLYLAALVCWAYGFQSRSKQGVDRFVPEKSVNAGSGLGSCDLTAPRKKPRLRRTREVASVKEEEEKEALNELGMIEYIEIVQRGKWMNVDKMKGKGGTNGMLIEVRHRLAENESWGRLGCEAEGVLGRLIDGRGGWEF